MSRTFLPKAHYMPWHGEYRPLYRWYSEQPWTLVPGGLSYPTAKKAIDAADEFLARGLNPVIRCEKAAETADPFGLAEWHEQRAAKAANDQEAVLGAVIVKGRQVKVERRRA